MDRESKLSLNEKAYQRIKTYIITMELSPGSQVDESSLMKKLSIGRTPIREALFRFVAEELVQAVPNRGFFVTSTTLEDVRSLFEAMLASIRDHALLAARRVKKEHIERLWKVHKAHQEATRKRDFLQVTLLNTEFHRTICESANNRYLLYSFNHIQNQAQRLSYLSYSQEMPPYDLDENFRSVIESHRAIISLLEKKDESGLLEKMTEHSEQFRSRISYYLSPLTEVLERSEIAMESRMAKGREGKWLA